MIKLKSSKILKPIELYIKKNNPCSLIKRLCYIRGKQIHDLFRNLNHHIIAKYDPFDSTEIEFKRWRSKIYG